MNTPRTYLVAVNLMGMMQSTLTITGIAWLVGCRRIHVRVWTVGEDFNPVCLKVGINRVTHVVALFDPAGNIVDQAQYET